MEEVEKGSIEVQTSLFNRSRDYYGETTLEIIVIVFRDGNIPNRNREEIYLYLELAIYSIEIQDLLFNSDYNGEILSENIVIEY